MINNALPRAFLFPVPHPARLQELIDELSPELTGRGFTPKRGHALWARDLPSGLESVALAYSPDDEHGGWVEPFLGLVEQHVETTMATALDAPVTYGMRHTLLVGATKWTRPGVPKLPMHDASEVLEATNGILRWLDAELPRLAERFCAPRELPGGRVARDIDLGALDALFNEAHADGGRYAPHELYRSIRGLVIAQRVRPYDLVEVLSFHRGRLIDNGFWEVYGEQIRRFAASLG